MDHSNDLSKIAGDLQPCPFCGSKPDVVEDSFATSKEVEEFAVCNTPRCALDGLKFRPEEWSNRALTTATADLEQRLKKAEGERDLADRSTHMQANCIHQCAAIIGPDTSGAIDGLPLAVKHLVAERAQGGGVKG